MSEEENILIIDTQVTGHHFEYIKCVYQHVGLTRANVFLLVNPISIDKLSLVDGGNVKVISSPVSLPNMTKERIYKEVAFFREAINEYAINRALFLNINPYQSALTVGKLRSLDVEIEGILFSPPHRIRYHKTDNVRRRLTLLYRKYRKYAQLWLLTRNRDVSRVFILDDKEGSETLSKKVADVFCYLPDPMECNAEIVSDKKAFAKKYGIRGEDKVVLAFGAIAPRKNLEATVAGFCSANIDDAVLLIAGAGNEVYLSKVRKYINNYEKPPGRQVMILSRFVSEEEMNEMFANCDAVVMAYKNFYGSSGVLGHAAAYAKPTVATEYGLVNYLVHKYNLGVTVSPSFEGIRGGLETVLAQGFRDDFDVLSEYLSEKSVKRFVTILLNT